MADGICDHYCTFLNNEQILESIKTHYPDGPDLYQLAPIDQLHTGGIKASERLLAALPDLPGGTGLKVLDIGSGLGGVMRLGLQRLGCQIIGLDLTHQFNVLNRALGALSDPAQAMQVTTADGQRLPFADSSFDLVLYQHSLVNMPDKRAALTECRRVLSKQGQLILHELVQGPEYQHLTFPVPWASHAEHSHLMTEQELRDLLDDCDYSLSRFEDWTDDALAWRKRQSSKETGNKADAAPLSPAMVLGPDFRQMGQNIMTGLQIGALKVIEVRAAPAPDKIR